MNPELGYGSAATRPTDVRFWHKADIPTRSTDVRLLGVKRTLNGHAPMSAFDPKRTSVG